MLDAQPPRLARWLLARALTGAARSAIVGDLDEEFTEEALSRLGRRRARRWYWRQALRSIVDHCLQRPIGWKDRSERPGVRVRDVLRGEPDALISDLRYAVRRLARQPGLTVVAVITLTLGIGSNVAIFSVLNATLLKPLPVREPARLFGIRMPEQNVFNRAWYAALKEAGPAFDGIAAYAGSGFLLDTQNGSFSVFGAFVSGNYFATLGLEPARGRLLTPADDRAGAEPVAVISHRLWHTQFGGRPDIVGQSDYGRRNAARDCRRDAAGISSSRVGSRQGCLRPDFDQTGASARRPGIRRLGGLLAICRRALGSRSDYPGCATNSDNSVCGG